MEVSSRKQQQQQQQHSSMNDIEETISAQRQLSDKDGIEGNTA